MKKFILTTALLILPHIAAYGLEEFGGGGLVCNELIPCPAGSVCRNGVCMIVTNIESETIPCTTSTDCPIIVNPTYSNVPDWHLSTYRQIVCSEYHHICTYATCYACDSGYYSTGTQTASASSCVQCPIDSATNTRGTTLPNPLTCYTNTITDCYIPKNTTGSDAAGTFYYSNECFYTE